MTNNETELLQEVQEASAFITPLKQEINQIISGQQELIDRLIIGLITSGHLLVEGVPGLAKTLTINSLAQAVDGAASRLQFTPDLLPADIVGTSIYNPQGIQWKHTDFTQLYSLKRNAIDSKFLCYMCYTALNMILYALT